MCGKRKERKKPINPRLTCGIVQIEGDLLLAHRHAGRVLLEDGRRVLLRREKRLERGRAAPAAPPAAPQPLRPPGLTSGKAPCAYTISSDVFPQPPSPTITTFTSFLSLADGAAAVPRDPPAAPWGRAPLAASMERGRAGPGAAPPGRGSPPTAAALRAPRGGQEPPAPRRGLAAPQVPQGPARDRAAASPRVTPGGPLPEALSPLTGLGCPRYRLRRVTRGAPALRRTRPRCTPQEPPQRPTGLLPPQPAGAGHPRPPAQPPRPPSTSDVGSCPLCAPIHPPRYPRLGTCPRTATMVPASSPPAPGLICSSMELLWASGAMLVYLRPPAAEGMASSSTSTHLVVDPSHDGQGGCRGHGSPSKGSRDAPRYPTKRILLPALGVVVTCCLFYTVFIA